MTWVMSYSRHFLIIETEEGQMPSRDIVYAPEGCAGVSIANNYYISGRMVMMESEDTLYDSKEFEKGVSGIKIKIRGNSTGAYMDQHPYKIKLSKKEDLLRRDNPKFKHKEWGLLGMYTWNIKMTNQESNILAMVGTIVSKAVEQEWTPEYDIVHVVLNGDYQGMYYLIELVERGDMRVDISKNGFLIEHDTFYWNEDVYFRTDNQYSKTGFSYKYPDGDDVNDSIQETVKGYMNAMENQLYHGGNVSDYLDYDSFAKWILIHDILGTDDFAGCNRYLYKDSFLADSKLKMGPVWDFDSTFRSDGWSYLHTSSWFYYPQLYKNPSFVRSYQDLWNSVRPDLLRKLHKGLDDLENRYGEVFDESMALHQTKYPTEGHQPFASQIAEVREKLDKRVMVLDSLMLQSGYTNVINDMLCFDSEVDYFTDVCGRNHYQKNRQNLSKGVYVIHYVDGKRKKIFIQ